MDLQGRSIDWFLSYETNIDLMWVNNDKSFGVLTQPTFTCVKSTIKTPEQCVKSVLKLTIKTPKRCQ